MFVLAAVLSLGVSVFLTFLSDALSQTTMRQGGPDACGSGCGIQ